MNNNLQTTRQWQRNSWGNCQLEGFSLELRGCLVFVSVPSAPRRLRAFVTSRGGGDVTRQVRVDLRWSVPAEPGGIISSYHVLMATTLSGEDTWNITILTGEQRATKYSLVHAPINTNLYFKVSYVSYFPCRLWFMLLCKLDLQIFLNVVCIDLWLCLLFYLFS